MNLRSFKTPSIIVLGLGLMVSAPMVLADAGVCGASKTDWTTNGNAKYTVFDATGTSSVNVLMPDGTGTMTTPDYGQQPLGYYFSGPDSFLRITGKTTQSGGNTVEILFLVPVCTLGGSQVTSASVQRTIQGAGNSGELRPPINGTAVRSIP